MDKTTTSKETAVIELETLTPLFIKGKDPDYGEGSYLIGKKVYILDNDKLCKFIYDQTYDKDAKLRNPNNDYVKEYSAYLSNSYHSDKTGKLSIKSFLINNGLISNDPREAEKVVRNIAKGITYVSEAKRSKEFIVDGLANPYIPGSSIKGAIRNALLWAMLKESSSLKGDFKKFVQNRLAKTTNLNRKNKTEFATEFCTPRNRNENSLNAITSSRLDQTFQGEGEYEEKYIEKYNNRWKLATEMQKDLFRIIKISDANLITPKEIVMLEVKTYKLQGNLFEPKDFLTTLNGFPERAKARFKITIDKVLANEIFSGSIPIYLTSVSELLKAVNSFFRTIADEEQNFFSLARSNQNIVKVQDWYKPYRISDDKVIPESPLLFRLGWGGGMMTKTQFLHLSLTERTMVRNLLTDRGNVIAPQSRCLEVQRTKGNNNKNNEYKAVGPLGWCTLNYIGVDAEEFYHQKSVDTPKTPQPASQLPDQVKAVVVDIKSSPAKIRVTEGKYSNTETVMQKTLECLLLKNGSEVQVDLIISNGQLKKAEFKAMA